MKKLSLTITLLLAINLFGFDFSQIEYKPKFYFGYFVNEFSTKTNLSFKKDTEIMKELSKDYPTEGLERYGDKFFTKGIDSDYGQTKVKLGIDMKYKNFTLYFDNIFYLNITKDSFAPRMAEFYSGIKYNIAKDLVIGAEHLCLHPIISTKNSDSPNIFGGYNVISISYGY